MNMSTDRWTVALFFFFVATFISAVPVMAQKKVVAQGPPIFDTTSVAGVTITRVWQDSSLKMSRWPEVAIIEFATAESHQEFHRNPKAFLNKYKVFSKPVRAGQCLMDAKDEASATSWSSVVVHRRNSGYS